MTDKETAILLSKYESILRYSSERFDDEEWAKFDAFCKCYELALSEHPRPSSEAIKSAMDKAREYSLGNNSFTKEWAEYRDRIAGELGSGWISVDITKLPKSNNGFSEWVLVAYSRGMVDRDRYDFENNYWISKGDDVTHWQPLPSPPTK